MLTYYELENIRMQTLTTVQLEAILAIDLGTILAYAIKNNHKQLTITADTVVHYKRYIYLCAISTKPLAVPSDAIDEIWHAHLLHNASYEKMCRLVGKVIYHSPASDGDNSDLASAFENLTIASIRHFGSPAFLGIDVAFLCTNCSDGNGETTANSCQNQCRACNNACTFPSEAAIAQASNCTSPVHCLVYV
jgi:hypothetical protein